MNEIFSEFINTYESYFGKHFDDRKRADWFTALGGLKPAGLIVAIRELSKTLKFKPSVSEIISKYDELRRQQEREKREQRQNSLENQAKSTGKCYICAGTGCADYFKGKDGLIYFSQEKGTNAYICRCICSFGLSRFSDAQCDRANTAVPIGHKIRARYIPDLNDIMTADELELYKALKRPKPASLDFDIATTRGRLGAMIGGFALN